MIKKEYLQKTATMIIDKNGKLKTSNDYKSKNDNFLLQLLAAKTIGSGMNSYAENEMEKDRELRRKKIKLNKKRKH